MKITKKMVDYVSTLSRLDLPEEEKDAMRLELEKILQYMDVLEELDTAGVEPMSHAIPLKNVMREDRVAPSQDRSELLSNSPAPGQEAFLTPKPIQ